MLNRNKVNSLLNTLSESVSSPATLLEESTSIYTLVEDTVLTMDALIDSVGFETQSTTLEEMVEEAEAILAEAAGEMTPEMEEDFKAALGKMKGALAGLKGHMAKLANKAQGSAHGALSTFHHKRELGSAVKAAKAFASKDQKGFDKHLDKASASFEKGVKHSTAAAKAHSAVHGALARSKSHENPYAGVKRFNAPKAT